MAEWKVICPYCKIEADLLTGKVVYSDRPDLEKKKYWVCHPCEAHVGCKDGTDIPMGTLANDELRKARMEAHKAFDVAWKTKRMTRDKAYARLAKTMQIEPKKCHIGLFNLEQCKEVVKISERIK